MEKSDIFDKGLGITVGDILEKKLNTYGLFLLRDKVTFEMGVTKTALQSGLLNPNSDIYKEKFKIFSAYVSNLIQNAESTYLVKLREEPAIPSKQENAMASLIQSFGNNKKKIMGYSKFSVEDLVEVVNGIMKLTDLYVERNKDSIVGIVEQYNLDKKQGGFVDADSLLKRFKSISKTGEQSESIRSYLVTRN